MGYHSLKPGIGPSVLTCDLSRLAEEVKGVEPLLQEGDYVHLDVMDGNFVPAITFGALLIKGLRKHTNAYLSAHLMVSNPQNCIQDMADAGVDRLTFHLEAVEDVQATLESVKAANMKVGIAIRPGTPVERVLPYCKHLDLVLVMTVEPGLGGQPFMHDQMEKIRRLRKDFPDLDIEVDGGLNDKTVDIAAEAGANLIVAGSYVVKDPARNIATLRRSVQKYGNGKPESDLFPLPP